jgi:hypothetical protein
MALLWVENYENTSEQCASASYEVANKLSKQGNTCGIVAVPDRPSDSPQCEEEATRDKARPCLYWGAGGAQSAQCLSWSLVDFAIH